MHANSVVFKSLVWYGNNVRHRGSYRILNRLRRMTRADIDAEMVVERRGTRWALNPADFVHQDVFWHGTKDLWDVWHLKRLLPREALIVDIGSNFGYYAIQLARTLGRASRAIAFEPMPRNYERLSYNISLNGMADQVTALQVGLSDAPGVARMAARSGNSGSAQIGAAAGDHVDVRLEALDALWPTLAGTCPADFIKIDVEGHEPKALAGARGVLEIHQPIVLLEVDPPRLAEAGSSPAALAAFFSALGYRHFVCNRSRLEPVALERAPELVNVLCLHRDRHAAEIARWSATG
jgi:FkbM family methyltransferase